MRVGLEIRGAREVEAAFRRAPGRMRSELRAVIRRGTQQVRAEARARVAVRSGKTQRSIYYHWDWVGRAAVEGKVGSHWYVARWLEFGTAERKTRKRGGRGRMRARPFLNPALRARQDQIFAEVRRARDRVARSV